MGNAACWYSPARILTFSFTVIGFLVAAVSSWSLSSPKLENVSIRPSRSRLSQLSMSAYSEESQSKQGRGFAIFQNKEKGASNELSSKDTPVLFRPRPTVQFKSDDGKYAGPRTSPKSTIVNIEREVMMEETNKWNSFKNSLYDAADDISSLYPKRTNSKDILAGGYGDNIEEVMLSKEIMKEGTPGQRLMKDYLKIESSNINDSWKLSLGTWDSIKESVYSTVDNVSDLLENASNVSPPSVSALQKPVTKVVGQVVDEVNAIPQKVQKTQASLQANLNSGINAANSVVEDVKNIPAAVGTLPKKVQETQESVKSKVTSGFEVANSFVEDVKSIPDTVQTKVADVQKNVKDTTASAEEVFYNAKVVVGLEDPKPKPPRTPPPKPITAEGVAWKVAGVTAKGALAVGKGVTWVGWKGAQTAWAIATAKPKEKPDAILESAKIQIAEMKASRQGQKEEDGLQAEITAALELADKALYLASKEKKTSSKDLDDVVKSTKKAALKATITAAEIEQYLSKSKEEENPTTKS